MAELNFNKDRKFLLEDAKNAQNSEYFEDAALRFKVYWSRYVK